ncbi:polyprenyl synthetase family protein [candidate division KSB1 bacterium]|nr:polyprenyl synthetase family protein [candidate division KSB1 bacterium]
MDLKEITLPVADELLQFETAFQNALKSDVPLAQEVIYYILSRKGKRLRPLLVFLTAKLHGGLTEKTRSSSIIVEMLHTATLVHDDVVDASSLRRGSPTVNLVWNNKTSVLVGDFLFSKTLTSMLDLGDLKALAILAQTAKDLTEGEILQIATSNPEDMNESVYFELVQKKTASLISASCELGALSVSCSEEELTRMRAFGINLGIAFQIKDDILDYRGDVKNLGKPTGNDIRENKITLPLLLALSRSKESRRITELLQDEELGEPELEEILEFVNTNNGVEQSSEIAGKYAQHASFILESYPDSTSKTSLINLVNFVVNREK